MNMILKNLKDYIFEILVVFIFWCLFTSIIYGELSLSKSGYFILAGISIVLFKNIFEYSKKIVIFYIINLVMLLSILVLYRCSIDFLSAREIVKYTILSIGINHIIIYLFELNISECIKMFIWFTLFFIPFCVIWGYFFINGTWLLRVDTILAIMQTNLREAIEYLSVNISLAGWFIFIIVFIVFIIFLKKYAIVNLKKTESKKKIILFILLNIFFLFNGKDCFIINSFKDVTVYLERVNKFNEMREYRKNILVNELNTKGNKGNSGVYVLIIGESQNKKHMGSYGYNRDTTPWGNSMLNNRNFLLFTNAYACHTHTVQVLTYALTAKNQYNNLILEEVPSLLEVAEAAGFETVWISNQSKYGVFDTPITVIADEANQQSWINSTAGDKLKTDYYDYEVISKLDNIKYSDKMLIIIHLMGNHSSYKERYPNEFNKYLNYNSINQYDNSILYNDYVVKNIFYKVKTIPGFKSMVYFSDHAEDVDAGLGHDASRYTQSMIEIPFYMYFSDEYIRDNTQIYNNLENSKEKFFTNDLIFNTVLSIMNIKFPEFYESKNDLTSNQYDYEKSRFRTMHGEKKI